MKKTKRNAVLVIIAFLLVLGVAIYTAIFGVADRGKVEYIKLGLDLKGGLSVTYEIQEDDYSDKDLEDTKYKIEKRVEAYTNEYSVYEDGDKKITAEIPGVTNADEILEALNIEGKLEFLDPKHFSSAICQRCDQNYPQMKSSDCHLSCSYPCQMCHTADSSPTLWKN